MTESASAPRTPLILAFLAGGTVIVALSIFATGKRGQQPEAVPATTLVTADTPVTNPVHLQFVTAAPLHLSDMGWMADGLHLHVIIDSVPLMAGADEIAPIRGDTFAWRLPPMAAGRHAVRMFWSDGRHVPVGDTTTGSVTVRQ